jgi:uncharacterized delta-60 repeat protein
MSLIWICMALQLPWLASAALPAIQFNATRFASSENRSPLLLRTVLINDGFVEANENQYFRLSNPSAGSRLAAVTKAIAIVADNDAGVAFAETNLVVSENSAIVTLTVLRYDDGAGPLSVDYFTSDGSALAGRNYAAKSGMLNFPIFSTTNTVTIPLLDECELTDDRVFTVTLRNPSTGGALGTNQIAVVTIQGNDRPGRLDRSFVSLRRTIGSLIVPSEAYRDANPLAVLQNGQILCAISFERPLLELNSDGAINSTFNPLIPLSGSVVNTTLAGQQDGCILVSGTSIIVPGLFPVWFFRLLPSGEVDPDFHPPGEFNKWSGIYGQDVSGIAEQPDGRILLTRDIYAGYPPYSAHAGIVRLLPDGTFDHTFVPGNGASFDQWRAGARALALQPDGRILIGGRFTSFNDVPCSGLVRLEPNGPVDLSFNASGGPTNESGPDVSVIQIQSDGKILIAGGFTQYGATTRPGIARLLSNGALDTTFDPGTILGGAVGPVMLQPNGRIVIGGSFTNVQGHFRDGLARLNADGSLDQTFDPAPEQHEPVLDDRGASSTLASVALGLQADGRILVSGYSGLRRVEGDRTPRFREVTRQLNGDLRLSLESRAGKTYRLESSSNLLDWLPLQTKTASDCLLEFIDASEAGKRFYRAAQTAP